jgi:penicillin-binding protein 2
MWFQKKHFDPEIAPEEIFLDAENATFDRARFEGRLERPLSARTFGYLGVGLGFLFFILVTRGWNLQVTNGEAYASESASNSLEVTTLFAERGVITDMHGVVLAENGEKSDGSVERKYPYSSLSHVLGYVSYPKKDANGKYYDTEERGVTGIEAEYNETLAGTNGQILIETDALGKIRSQGSVVPAEDGKPVQLSIDIDLQRNLYRAIADTAKRTGFIAGAGVIIDTHSGGVRALVSYPSFDSNVMSAGSPSEIIASYNTNPGRPYIDHAIQGVYTPGSIVKPLLAAGALTDGLITPSTVIDDPGFLSLPDPYHPGKEWYFKGWKALGPVDVKKAIAWSSDVFFYSIAGGFKSQKGFGIDRLAYWYRQFGMGSTTGIALSGEAAGLIPTPEWKKKVFNEGWYLGDTYFTGIGQYSVQVTPIQMARATAAVANGGKLFTPTLLAGEISDYVRIPVDSRQLEVVRAGMRQAVTSALASALNLPYVSVAAKTGTAQTGTRNQYDNSWVIGFFPYDNPQYAFAVVLERGPEGQGEQAVFATRDFFVALNSENSIYTGGTGSTTAIR